MKACGMGISGGSTMATIVSHGSQRADNRAMASRASPPAPGRRALGLATLAAIALPLGAAPDAARERANRFGDPFVGITSALPRCPVPDAPGVTAQEAAEQAHDRAQRGVSCWLAGRCRLPNAYLYDAEIIPRVRLALQADGRFGATTSLWATGRRRVVWLQGCVTTAEEAAEVERIVRALDDVEGVVNQLMIGTDGPTPYRTGLR
jgi:hypothetical protein